MSSFLQRSLSGLVYVILFIGSAIYSSESFVTLTAIFGLICIREFSKLIKSKAYAAFFTFIALIVFFAMKDETIDGILILLALALSGSLQMLLYLFSKNIKVPKIVFLKRILPFVIWFYHLDF